MKNLKTLLKSFALLVLILLSSFLIFLKLTIYTFKGQVEQIDCHSDIPLKGVLIRPDSPGPHPAIILLHGAGAKHQSYDKVTFKAHANAFLNKGFAVLVYTKRGSGDNAIDYRYFTYKDLKNDALAAVKFLQNQPGIDRNNIGLMAVSESGWFSPEVAVESGMLRFIVNKVSSPFDVRTTIAHEINMDARDDGFTEQEIEDTILPLTERIWQFYIDVAKDSSLADSPERGQINQELSRLSQHERFGKWFTGGKLSDYDANLYQSRGQNYAYDPLPFLQKADIPMLYILGGKDKNIPTKEAVEFLEEFRKNENKDITIQVYPNASHYLNKWGREDGPWEGLIYVDGYLDLISDWAVKQVN